MKTKYLAICVFAAASVSLQANAGWTVYDNFNSGSIDTTKWDVDDDSAAIAVTRGAARFDTYPNMFDNSAWLQMKQDIDTIRGVRVKVRLKGACPGDIRARIGASTADVPGGNYLFAQHGLRSQSPDTLINSGISELRKSDDEYLRDRFWGYAPGYGDTEITDKWVVLTMFFTKPHNQRFWSNYDGQTDGEIKKKMSTKAGVRPVAPTEPFVAIGTRTRDNGGGDGQCRTWFDWVQVFR